MKRILEKPEKCFLLLLVIFSIPFFILILPTQTNDETKQFQRVYELSEGTILVNNNPKTAEYPTDTNDTHFIYQTKISLPSSIVAFITYKDKSLSQLLAPLNASKRSLTENNQFNSYSPIAYLPQAIIVFLARQFNSPPVVLDYLAKLIVLIIYGVLLYWSIKIIPVRKWAIVIIALMPKMLQVAISPGADMLSVVPLVLMTALIIRSYYERREPRQQIKELLLITALATVAVLSKPNVILISLLIPFYFAPSEKPTIDFLSKIKLLKAFAVVFPIFSYLIWSKLCVMNSLSPSDIFVNTSLNMATVKHSLLTAIGSFLSDSWQLILSGMKILHNSVNIWDNLNDLRWVSWQVTLPTIFSVFMVILLVMSLFVSYNETRQALPEISKRRLLFISGSMFILSVSIFMITCLILWLTWNKPSWTIIGGFQGRYLFSSLFLLAALPMQRLLKIKEKHFTLLTVALSSLVALGSVYTLLHGFKMI